MASDQACTVILADCVLDIDDTVDLCSKIHLTALAQCGL